MRPSTGDGAQESLLRAFGLAGRRIDAIPGVKRRRLAPGDGAVSNGPEAKPRTEV